MKLVEWARSVSDSYLIRDFFTFAKNTNCPDITEEEYREVCDYLESLLPNTPRIAAWRAARKRKYRRIALNDLLKIYALFLIPRLTFKTTLISSLVLFAFVLDPDIRIVLGRAKVEDAVSTLSGIKSYVEAPETALSRAFPGLRSRFTKWTDENILIGDRKPGLREHTVDTTGLNSSKTGFHPDFVILDDLVHENNYESAADMQKARIKVQAFMPIVERGGTLLLVGTRWGDNDVYGWVIDQDEQRVASGGNERWEKLIWGAYREDDPSIPRFPTALPEALINDLRETTDPKLFAAWILNKARAAGEEIFTMSYIQYIDGDFTPGPFSQLELYDTKDNAYAIGRVGRRIPMATVMLVDPAPTVGKYSDYTGIVVLGFDQYGNWYVLYAAGVKKLPADRLALVLYLARQFSPHTVAIENADMDAVLLQEKLKGMGLSTKVVSFNPRMDRKRITADPKLAPRGRTKKSAQIEGTEPILRAKRVYFIRGQVGPLVMQILKYPYLDHDDVIDAFSMGKAYEDPVRRSLERDEERIYEDIERQEYALEGIPFPGDRKPKAFRKRAS